MITISDSVTIRPHLASVDALRGFAMFWIIGGGEIFRALPKLSDNAIFIEIYNQLEHVPWKAFISMI